MPQTKVTKRNIIGTWFRHRFKRADGSLFEVECSEQEYRDLAKKDAKQPNHIDAKEWLSSYEGSKFDSPDGTIGNLGYFDDGHKYVVVDDKGVVYWVDYKDIVNDRIDFRKLRS